MYFTKNIDGNIGKHVSKNQIGKYSQRLLDRAKQSATDAFKTASKRAIKKTAEATGDLIDNKIADRITKVLINLRKINSETVTSENDKEIPKRGYINLQKI